MKKRLTTAQLRYSSVVRLFLLLLCVCGSNNVWASEEYLPVQNGELVTTSGTVALELSTTAQTIQATTHVQVTYGKGGWTVNGSKVTGSALASNGSGEYSYNNYACPTSGAYIVLTPSASGTIEVRGIKEGGGNKYMVIQTSNTAFVSDATVTSNGSSCEWKNERNGYNTPKTSSGNTDAIVATFNVTAGTPYYVLFDSFNAWSFTGFTFSKQAVDIADSDFGFIYSSKKTYMGENYEGNMFVNRHNVSVSYSSDDESVATVNASTGEVTLKSAGTAHITASFVGNDDYKSKNASYTLNVGSALFKTDIPISALRYQPGVNGINATGMARQVGGFNLTFNGGDGIKCNNTNNFFFRTNSSGAKGTMQIAMNSSNSSKYIKKIVFTAWNTPSLTVTSVTKTSGTLTQTGTKEWTWTNFAEDVTSVNFTSQGENGEYFLVSNIKVYTTEAPTFQKVTPTPAFNRNSDSFTVGATVDVEDLAINTSPTSFLFDYDFDEGTTGLTHTPYTTNATWPGTITGTAAEGTATISASFSDDSNPFYNTKTSTPVYTLTVSSAAKNTFVWDFTKGISTVDQWLLLKDKSNDAKWVQTETNGTTWRLQKTISEAAFTQNGSTELEYAYGLQLDASASTQNLLNDNTTGFGLRKDHKLIIPDLTLGDEISITFTANKDRGIYLPTHISDGVNFGPVSANGTYTATGTITAGTDTLVLAAINNISFKNITVRRAMKPWPSMSFANGSKVNVEIPYGETSTTYTNALTNVPTGGSVTYEVLLSNASVDVAGGTVTQDGTVGIDPSTGALSNIKEGTTIVRAKFTSESSAFSDYYCDYILNATQASEFASWEYSADSKEIDGEDRPYQGSYTITKSGNIKSTDRVVTAIPGIKMTMGNLDETWYVTTIDGVHYAKTDATTERTTKEATKGNFYKFEPIVNGFLSVTGRNSLNHLYLMDGNSQVKDHNGPFTGKFTEIENYPLIAGTTYYIVSQNEFNLHSFTFRPAFLTPDETAEQTETFVANSSTTAFPKLVHNADAGVRFSGNRSVVNLSNNGGVTLVGGGTAVVRGKVIAGENELTASYTLEANVLSVAGMTPANGSTITTLDNHSVYIQFSANISTTVDATKVVVLKDAQQLTGINVAKAGSSVSSYENTLVLSNFPAMEAGSTYTIRLMSGCVSKDGDVSVKNPEFIGTFTVESSEPPLNWVYPSTTSAVRIGTSIVLQTNNNIDENYPNGGVVGTLTYDGVAGDSDYPMNLVAIKDGKNLVFKPTKPMVPNKLYTLTIGANQVKLKDATSMITKDKVFMFTTGTATGSAPVLTSSTPANEAAIDLPANTDKINLYFDQNLELEPYSTVSIIPVNGSESLSRGTSEKLNDNGVLVAQNMTIDSENPQHLSFEVGSDLKYDLYYEMVIPANIVTAPGGMPNSASTVKFKINRNPNSHEVNASTFYPHTWDFNKFGDQTVATTTAYNIINNYGDSKETGKQINSLYVNGYSYTTKAQTGYGFDQGNDVYFNNKSGEKETLDEFEGIRISLVKSESNRFELAKVTKTVGDNTVVDTNVDGTTKWQFRMNGNTHYMTLSKVPAGKLYMVVNSPYLGINSPNATFESVSGEGYTLENDNTLLNTNGTKKVVINVAQAGDVSFCVKNFTCEKMAVAAHTKTFKPSYKNDSKTKTYASDRVFYDVRYDLLNEFTDHNVKAYYITGITNNSGVNTADITATQVPLANAAKADEGVLVVYQGGVDADTEVPIFKADVNTESGEVSNLFRVIAKGSTTFPTADSGYYNYVLSSGGSKSTGVGFYRYTGTTFSDRAAYLPIPIAYVNTGSGSSSTSSKGTRLLLLDADEQVATAILEVKGDGIATRNNDGYFYNLNGMRVEHPKAGIYIRNGKKVVMK